VTYTLKNFINLANPHLGIEWTTQADFGILPAPWINGSLLILGSRAGILTFLRFSSIINVNFLSLSDRQYIQDIELVNLRNKLLHYPLPIRGLHILHFLLGTQCSQDTVRYLT
jgi:hypothetical protein